MHVTAESPYEVRQSGERTLWDEVQAAYQWWVSVGEPAVDAWRFTITSSGQRVELPPLAGERRQPGQVAGSLRGHGVRLEPFSRGWRLS